jgi:hypothetical protein
MYSIVYERRAKMELEDAKETYGGTFREEVDRWQTDLVRDAENRVYSVSIDAAAMMEAAVQSRPSSWRLSWKRWLSAPLIKKIQAILLVVGKRCPPWEFRASAMRFTVVNAFDCEVVAFYEVDHVARRVIFRLFDGLPGQE